MSDSENSDGEEESVPEFHVPLQTVLDSAEETLMQFLEREDDTSFKEIILLRKIGMNSRKKIAEIVSKVRCENSFLSPKQPLCACARSSLGCKV